MSIESRKIDHIEICLEKNTNFRKKNGFEKYELRHKALADFNFSDISTETEFLNHRLNFPIVISSMTGGCGKAEKINKNLAKAAQKFKIAMSCGSQKAMIKNRKLSYSHQIRDVAPDILYLGNIGLDYLRNEGNFKKIKLAVETIEANGIFVHLNLAQELVQQEGERNFSNSRKNLESFVNFMGLPVLAKEVGFGISGEVAVELEKTSVSAIDISGSGGTSWTKVEKYRQNNSNLAERFSEWGMPTTESLIECGSAVKLPLIASGGIYDGITACKAFALGADLVGIAGPLLKEADESSEAVEIYLNNFILELKTAMMLIGAKNLKELKNNKKVIKLIRYQ